MKIVRNNSLRAVYKPSNFGTFKLLRSSLLAQILKGKQKEEVVLIKPWITCLH